MSSLNENQLMGTPTLWHRDVGFDAGQSITGDGGDSVRRRQFSIPVKNSSVNDNSCISNDSKNAVSNDEIAWE
jgi:hypothetical protein